MIPDKNYSVLNQFSDPDLIRYLRTNRNLAVIVWQAEDVLDTAEDMGFILTRQQAEDIVHLLDDRHDATFGITWDTVESYVDDLIQEMSYTVELLPSNDRDGVPYSTKFCSLQTNENIEDYYADDEYYFYGISQQELKKYEGKYFRDADCIIVEVGNN